ncbi:MAG: UDP-3-O-(3-hydroxymyristoyl)glucosamine N-acyltransferase [Flavobacteriales bacterium]|jgi:UDP-3-O-[3-hydroxymyristoyl] glucosamine N-acyltransferase|nr:UDP-3-O-(3-hydroxymyristoyl)glucosamine N-acyltransferase [Flavobacteriales bacterium]HRO40592.1 UDP-3-O-(3-hydroxymyristoyl)glucosamine N-acyltransferase [Flavobacteriales bacterium]HRP82599.1 UDP-3-O-(3-hydroxymyristoyl)glucosamine N-acyltransferase [Flavobacteriales bacterium]
MELKEPLTAASVAGIIHARVAGNAHRLVTGINEINRVREGDLVFVDHPKYYEKALRSAATTILIDKEGVDIPEGKAILVSRDPFSDYNKLVRHFMAPVAWTAEPPAIGPDTAVHSSVVVGTNVTIGSGCTIMPGVVIYPGTTIGNRVVIHANAVIGGDGFYYKKRAGGYEKMVTAGSVVIEDDVEVGAGTTIDRGVSADTRIGAGTKIDNQVQVGHDTLIGRNCLIAAQVGISGACTIGDNVTLWGQVGVPSKLTIGAGATVLGQSGLIGDLEPGKTYFGSPAGEWKQKMREVASLAHLPEMLRTRNR